MDNNLAVSNGISAVDSGFGANRVFPTLPAGRYFVKVESSTGSNITGNCRVKVGYKTVFRYTYDVGSGNSIYIMGGTAGGDPIYPLSWATGREASWTTGNVWVWETFELEESFNYKATRGAEGQTVGTIWESGDNHVGNPGQTCSVTSPTW